MRRLDRLLALILGLALAGVAVLTGMEIMVLVLGKAAVVIPRHAWDQSLRDAAWSGTGAVVASAAAAGVGVVLILLQLIRRKPVRLALLSPLGQRLWVSRRGLARRLGRQVAALDAVGDGRVRVGRRRVRARAALEGEAERAVVVEEIRGVVGSTLSTLGVVADLKIRVKAKAPSPPPSAGE